MTHSKTAPAGTTPPNAARVDRAAERAESTPSRIGGQADRVIATIPRGAAAIVRIAITTFKGRPGLDVRLFEAYRTTGELGPTARGIRLRLDELEEVRAAIDAALLVASGGERGQ